jgi:hypothetical protein
MKLFHFSLTRIFCLLGLLFTLSLVSAQAQEPEIKLESLDKLAPRAFHPPAFRGSELVEFRLLPTTPSV